MPLSVQYSNGGNSPGHLFKPARPVKTTSASPSVGSGNQKTAAQARSASSVIDSTGIGTAHIAAALTVYMSTLGTTGDDASDGMTTANEDASPDRAGSFALSSSRAATGSGATDLLRVLDAYAS